MYSVPSYRIRAYLRGQQQRKIERRKRLSNGLHYKRSPAEIRLTSSFSQETLIIPCRVVLNDLSPEGVFLFSPQVLHVGQQVSLTIHHPKKIYLSGTILACKQLLLEHRVLADQTFDYRVGVRFDMKSNEERETLINYYRELFDLYLRTAA